MNPTLKKIVKTIVASLSVLFSFIAVNINPGGLNPKLISGSGFHSFLFLLRSELFPLNPVSVIFSIVVILFLIWSILRHQTRNVSALILSFVFSFFLLIGDSFAVFKDFAFISFCAAQSIIALITFLGYWVILYFVLHWLFTKSAAVSGFKNTPVPHFFLISMIVLLLVWLILMIPFLPGSVPHDGRHIFDMFYGVLPFDLRHAFLPVIVQGSVYHLGFLIGGSSFGCILFVLFQSLAGAIVFARICEYVSCKAGKIPGILSLVFFALIPAFWTYMQAILKDTLFFILFSWFVLEYVRIILNDLKRSTWIQLTIAGVLACEYRNEAFFTIFLGMIVLILLCFRHRKKLRAGILAGAGIIAVFLCTHLVVYPLAGYNNPQAFDALSIPIQQVACVVHFHSGELSKEVLKTINNVFDVHTMIETYEPEASDPVKNTFHAKTEEQKQEFIKLYFKWMGCYPKEYSKAAINLMFGYTDPRYFFNTLSDYQLYTKDNLGTTDENIVYSDYFFPDDIRNKAHDLTQVPEKIPVLSLLVSPAFYVWIILFCFACLIYKKQYGMAAAHIIPIVQILICLFSPANGLLRYALPLMATAPIWLMLAVCAPSKRQILQNRNDA